MRRGIRISVLLALALLLCAVLAACGCKHEEVVDPAAAATCTEDGLTEGKHCSLCDKVLTAQEVVPATGHTEEADAAVEATCTESGLTAGSHCSVCGEALTAQTTVAALGHTTDSGVCDRCGESMGIWSLGHYVDDFDQPTDEWYVWNQNMIAGSFNNSATTNSALLVQVLVDADDVTFFLYEYGRNQVKNNSSNYVDEYEITMRTADGSDHALTGTLYCGGDRIVVDDRYKSDVLSALQGEGTVSFYIVESDFPTTNYLFSVEPSNFATEYQAAKG